jgi:hypothetical protein
MKKQKTNPIVKPAAEAAEAGAFLTIDGTTYELACDFNTLADHEPVAGCNLLHAIPALLLNTLSAIQLRGLLYASLQKFQPYVSKNSGVSLMTAGQMVRVDTIPDIYAAIAKTELLVTHKSA